MKKVFKNIKVIILFMALITAGIGLILSVIKYNKITNYYSEKVVAVKVDEIEESYDYVGWLNIIKTETHYNYVYEYEWNGEIYKIELEKSETKNLWNILKTIFTGTGNGEKLVCHLNPKTPNEATLETTNEVAIYSVCFFITLMCTAYTTICVFEENAKIRKGEDYIKKMVWTCPCCKSENVTAREVKHINKSSRVINQKRWLFCRDCDYQEVRLEKEETYDASDVKGNKNEEN